MTGNPSPEEILDAALAQPPGQGILLGFQKKGDRERFRWRCYALMSAEARRSQRELEPTSVGWGKHSWGDISVQRRGELSLWIGRNLDIEITMEEGVTQEAED